jgi:hypothetical protein
MDQSEKDKIRLSDRILSSLQLALEQKDLKIAETLARAMELSMTRNAGGGDFVERRDYPAEIEKAMDMLYDLRDQQDKV